MLYYEIECSSCRQTFKLYEGTLRYRQFKERESKTSRCEECNSTICMVAIKNFRNNLSERCLLFHPQQLDLYSKSE